MKKFGKPLNFVKAAKHRMPLLELYKIYKMWFGTESRNYDMDCKWVTSIKLKEVLILNGFEIRRVTACRAQIQGIRLRVQALKKLFENSTQCEE